MSSGKTERMKLTVSNESDKSSLSSSSENSKGSFDRIRHNDLLKAEELRKKGPDILTGNGYESQIYRSRLDKREKRSRKELFFRIGDTREKLVKEVADKFEERFRNLKEFTDKNTYSVILKVVGLPKLTFSSKLNTDKEAFDRYKAEALKGTTTMNNQLFDRMLAHLDMFQNDERLVAEWKKGGNATSQESKVKLDKDSLDKVYNAFEKNYKDFYKALQEKKDILARKIKPKESYLESLDQQVEEVSRDWYRAFEIIQRQTHQAMVEVTTAPTVREFEDAGKKIIVADPIRDRDRLQPMIDDALQTYSKDNVIVLTETQLLQKYLEASKEISKEEASKLAHQYEQVKHCYKTDLTFLHDTVGLYGGELGKQHETDSDWEIQRKRKIEGASHSVVENTKRVLALAERITQLLTKPEKGDKGKEKTNDPLRTESGTVNKPPSSNARESETTFEITNANDPAFFKNQKNIWDQ